MVIDWLGMVKGKNMPDFLKNPDVRRAQVFDVAEDKLGHTVGRNEAVILRTGMGAFADSYDRDPVTRLYKVHFCAF